LPEYHPFRSAIAKKEYLKLYDQKASKWPVESHVRILETTHGHTFVRVSGPVDAQPLVLLHGIGGNSLQWLHNIEAFASNYRVYAVDSINDYGRSIYKQPIKASSDYVIWLDELFNALGLEKNINLVGLSYGGWLTSQYALHRPDRLEKIVLIAPAATVLPLSREWIMRAVQVLSPFRGHTRRFMRWLLNDLARKGEAGRAMFDEEVDAAFTAIKCFKPLRMVKPTVLKDSELRNIKLPVLYLIGENEKICSARKAIRRLQKVAPQIKTGVIPNAGHDLTMVQADLVNEKVLDFLNKPKITISQHLPGP
jgi:pimeloyl-ACP methyl ester carboxylesterase